MSSPPASPVIPLPTASSPEELFQHVESYPWASDEEFQSGLRAILGPSYGVDSVQSEDLALRARCFYYTRKSGSDVDFSSYRAWRDSQPQTSLNPLHLLTENAKLTEDTINFQPNFVERGLSTQQTSEPPHSTANGASGSTQQGQYPSKFAQIVDLIQSGKPVPGIKDIPDIVLVGQGTESSQSMRAKPWEQARDVHTWK